MWSVCTELLRCMHGVCITCTAMHATVCVRKFVVNKISNGPGDEFLRAPIQTMTPSTALIQRHRHDGKDPSSRDVKRGALQRERSSSVQTELTGHITRV